MDLEHVRVDDLAALPAALEPRRGIRLVEIRADRTTLRAGHAAIRAAIAAAL